MINFKSNRLKQIPQLYFLNLFQIYVSIGKLGGGPGYRLEYRSGPGGISAGCLLAAGV